MTPNATPGHFILALDIARFVAPADFKAEVDRHLRDLATSRTARCARRRDRCCAAGTVMGVKPAVISVVAVSANGDIIEMATIGREGCTCFQAVFRARGRQSGCWFKSLEPR
jgi:hypothetical protein